MTDETLREMDAEQYRAAQGANTEKMSPAEVLAVMEMLGILDDAGGSIMHAQREGVTTTVNYDQIVKVRTAVAALIAREAEQARRIAELEAEREALRVDAERANYWKQRARSAEGHLPSADIDAASKAVHMASNLSETAWGELRRDQQLACYMAARAAVQAVNRARDDRKPKDAARTERSHD